MPYRRTIALLLTSAVAASTAEAGVVFGLAPGTLDGGSRWDAALRIVDLSGLEAERSLVGGLRFSLQGGSFQAYRDLFAWQGAVPSVAAFQQAVEDSFAAWPRVDPASGIGSSLSFVADLATPVVGFNIGGGGLNVRGAEIDLFGSRDAGFWNLNNSRPQGETRFGTINGPVKLTSGTENYAAAAILGADIIINNNPQALYTLDFFRRLMTHEIGHAIGLGDVEGDINPGSFIDDNFDGSSPASAFATLNNSWASSIDPLNPAGTPGLSRYTVPFGDPGTLTNGVDILMESRGLGIAFSNPVENLSPLTNDDYATRQFLYPQAVPEPATMFALAAIGPVTRRRSSLRFP